MTRPLLIAIGLACALVTAAGIMHYHHIQSIRLPIMTQERTEGRGFPGLEQQKTAYLPNDYGFLLNYLGQTEPEFYLYNRPAWTITVTGDFRQFIAGLKQFPDGAKVDRIHKCQVSFEYGMPAYEIEWLNETIASKGFRMTDEEDGNWMIEGCEFQETLLKDIGRPAKKTPEPAKENITPEQIIELADKLYNGSPDDVYCAVKALRELKNREAIKQVIGFLSHPESETRNAAADILGFWQAEKAIPPLIRLLSDPDAEVRHSSVYALILLKATEAIPEITGLLSDSDARVRSKAVDALDELYAYEATPEIIKLLSDPDENVCLSAIRVLDAFKTEEAIPNIKRLLSDPKVKIRTAAEETLKDIGVPEEEIQKAKEQIDAPATYHEETNETYLNKYFQISIESNKEVYKENEPINLTITLKNVSKYQYTYLIPDVADDTTRFWTIESNNGKFERIKPYAQGTLKKENYTMLNAGKIASYTIDIKTIWKLTPGTYKIKASYQGQNRYQNPNGSITEMKGAWWGKTASNTITIELQK